MRRALLVWSVALAAILTTSEASADLIDFEMQGPAFLDEGDFGAAFAQDTGFTDFTGTWTAVFQVDTSTPGSFDPYHGEYGFVDQPNEWLTLTLGNYSKTYTDFTMDIYNGGGPSTSVVIEVDQPDRIGLIAVASSLALSSLTLDALATAALPPSPFIGGSEDLFENDPRWEASGNTTELVRVDEPGALTLMLLSTIIVLCWTRTATLRAS